MILEAPVRTRPACRPVGPATPSDSTERMMNGHETLRDRAYQLIRRALLLGQIRAGERLGETEWAARLEVNRTAVREACGRLRAEGLVVEGDKGGYFAAHLDAVDVQDLREIRAQLEALAAERICGSAKNRSEAARLLRRVCRDLEWILEEDYPTLWNQAELRFHEALIAAAGSRQLGRLYRCLPPLDAGLPLGDPRAWKEAAADVLLARKAAMEALEKGDAEAATRLLGATANTTSTRTDALDSGHPALATNSRAASARPARRKRRGAMKTTAPRE